MEQSDTVPPLYPDAIARTPRVSAAHVLAAIDRTRLGYSVKDTFVNLELTAYGINRLFGATGGQADTVTG